MFCSLQGSHQSCLLLQSPSLPGRCLSRAAAVWGPYCWPCCFRPPWKRMAGAWRAASVRTSPWRVTCWYVGHSHHVGLGIRWNWGWGWGRNSAQGSAMGEGKFIPRNVGKPRSGIDPHSEVSMGPRRGRSSYLEIVTLK